MLIIFTSSSDWTKESIVMLIYQSKQQKHKSKRKKNVIKFFCSKTSIFNKLKMQLHIVRVSMKACVVLVSDTNYWRDHHFLYLEVYCLILNLEQRKLIRHEKLSLMTKSDHRNLNRKANQLIEFILYLIILWIKQCIQKENV